MPGAIWTNFGNFCLDTQCFLGSGLPYHYLGSYLHLWEIKESLHVLGGLPGIQCFACEIGIQISQKVICYCNVWCCPSVSQWNLELLNLDWTLTPNVEHPTLSTWTLKVCQWLLHHSTLSIGAIIHNFQIWTLQHDISHRPQQTTFREIWIPISHAKCCSDEHGKPGVILGWPLTLTL